MMYNLKKELINLIFETDYNRNFKEPQNIKRHAKGLLKAVEKEEKAIAKQNDWVAKFGSRSRDK